MSKLYDAKKHDDLAAMLRQQIKECLDLEYSNEGTSEEDF